MAEISLPSNVINTVNNLTDADFLCVRSDQEDIDPLFIDETDSPLELIANDELKNIQDFKNMLLYMYLPYFAEHLQTYVAAKPAYFIVDGTSALPYAYMFKEAFRTYQKLHPDEQVSVPTFLFMDIHPLRQKKDEMTQSNFLTFVDSLQEQEFSSLWGEKGAQTMQKAVHLLKEQPSSTIITFDEFSDPTQEYIGSLRILNRFIATRIPTLNIITDSPEIDLEKNKVHVGNTIFWQTGLIDSYHADRPIKRIVKGSGELRRPSLLKHPIAHHRGIALLQECRKLGRLIAQSA